MIKNILIYLIFIITICYWIITIFFTLPDNPIRVKYLFEEKLFEIFFYQKWSFFAPPPVFNDRLYYTFRLKSDTSQTLTYEVIEPIQTERRENAPFNESISVVDYILLNNMEILNNEIRADYKSLKTIKSNISDIEIEDSIKYFFETKYLLKPSVITLFNYGVVVGKKNKLPLEKYEMKFAFVHAYIPKFKDRNLVNKEISYEKSLESPYVDISKYETFK